MEKRGKRDSRDDKKGVKKRRPIRSILKFIGCLLVIVIVLVGGLLAYLSVTEFKPEDVTDLSASGSAERTLKAGNSISVLSWNTGYGALGDNADFFMDGGMGVKTADEERVMSNMDGIIANVVELNPDIALIQETDINSTRSNHINEYEMLKDSLSGYESYFANNFKVAFLPYPVPPIGKVDSGIATFSKYQASAAMRIQLPIPFTWPVSMANLKRCLLITRMPVDGDGRELVIMNLHLEAYDNGEGKIAQTKMLSALLNAEYKNGNYVIAGGDFNQIFSTCDADAFPVREGMWEPGLIDTKTVRGEWQFLMDESIPSCRSLDQPYTGADLSDFQYYLIDGFIVSSNIKVDKFENIDTGFVYSDHNPVYLEATLK